MSNYIKEYSKIILSLPRYSKQIIALITDICLCIICTWLAFVIRLEELILFKDFNYDSAIISTIIAIPIFWLFGLYRIIFRYTGLSIIFTILMSIFVYGLLYFLVIGVFSIKEVPRSIGILQPMLLFFAIMASRLGVKYLLTGNLIFNKYSNKKDVLIYGAGEAGRQLVIALENSPEFRVAGFLDDNDQLHRQIVVGKTVYSVLKLEKLIQTLNIGFVFLAMPSISRGRRNQIIEKINKYKLNVKTLPSISEIVDGTITISDVKDFRIDDLLNRKEVKPNYELLNSNIYLKTVLVTGAGGSIGSELCRQIIKLKPSKIILIELNEYTLYKINEELKSKNHIIKIVPLLINSQDQEKLEMIFDTFNVDTVYHAAAYKHVPLVEENICEGVRNNVFSTLAIIRASINKRVSSLVLISSDKAVRPTNIMGASKRLCELCMQGLYNYTSDIKTNFSIVRFGNVLESSGSVIPKFKKQIKEGGPVTLNHEDVSRYFMTVSEAAQLVIQSGAMGKKSEVFVLDMGESVKIRDIIDKMIKLSGLSVKDYKNPNGDIEIKITGLRPGEKLYEELLIGNNPQETKHPKIKKINDPFIPYDQLKEDLNNLKNLLDNNQANDVKKFLFELLKSYKPSEEMIDHVYVERQSKKNKKNFSLLKNKDSNIINLR